MGWPAEGGPACAAAADERWNHGSFHDANKSYIIKNTYDFMESLYHKTYDFKESLYHLFAYIPLGHTISWFLGDIRVPRNPEHYDIMF